MSDLKKNSKKAFESGFGDGSYRPKERMAAVAKLFILGLAGVMLAITFFSFYESWALLCIFFGIGLAYVGIMDVYRFDDLLVPNDPVWVRSHVKGSIIYGCAAGLLLYGAIWLAFYLKLP